MHRTLVKVWGTALLLSAAALAQSGQSLGDIARANREKQKAEQAAGIKPRTITNADVPNDPPGVPQPDPSEPMTMVSGVSRPVDSRSDQRLNQRLTAEQQAGNQWRERIQMQEGRVADLQARIDQMNALMRPNGSTAQYDGPYTRNQARQAQRMAQLQEMLDQQKQKLAMMQEAARHSGMHTTVYDP